MIDLDRLEKLDESQYHFMSSQFLWLKFYESYFNNQSVLDIPVYSLKNLEEITGTLLMISINREDPTIGYCVMDLGSEKIRIVIPDPKETFKTWQEAREIFFLEKVGILRIDQDGCPRYFLRYLSSEISELSMMMTRDLENFINNADEQSTIIPH
jgi:hypothetical protein